MKGRKLIARLTSAGIIIDLPKKKTATAIAGKVIMAPARSMIFIRKAPVVRLESRFAPVGAPPTAGTRQRIFNLGFTQEANRRTTMNPQQHSSDLIFWDVDTQFDFMTPPDEGGLLYVKDLNNPRDPGAQEIVGELARLSAFAKQNDILRVATGDWHSLDHREIDSENPDFRTTYPPHCMAGEQGASKIPETALSDPLILPLRADPALAWDIERRAVREGRDIFIQKEEFSCFAGNPATEALLEALDPKVVVVYGVSLDVCVKHAVEGLLERGRTVYLVEDATWGLGLEDPEKLMRSWEDRGLVRVTTDEAVEGALRLPQSSFP
jgi:nicotinamidase/pyrazinamidase